MSASATDPVQSHAQSGNNSAPPPSTRRISANDQTRIVRRYLSAVESAKPGRNARRTAEAIGHRILKIDELLVSADPLTRLHLTQERTDLHTEQIRLGGESQPDIADLERQFVRIAKAYGDRTGVTYAAWRQVGVDAGVLERAGIIRGRPSGTAGRPRDRERAGATPVEGTAGTEAGTDGATADRTAPPPEADGDAKLPRTLDLDDAGGATFGTDEQAPPLAGELSYSGE